METPVMWVGMVCGLMALVLTGALTFLMQGSEERENAMSPQRFRLALMVAQAAVAGYALAAVITLFLETARLVGRAP